MLMKKWYVLTALSTAIAASITTPAASGPSAGLARSLNQKPAREFINTTRHTLAPFAFIRFCVANPEDCTVGRGPVLVEIDPQLQSQLGRINTHVNKSIRPINDNVDDDVWEANVTRGDCEDYALTKRRLLVAAGWPSRSLRIAVGKTSSGEGHAVLVVKTSQGDLVLDNRTNAIKPWHRTGLRWEKIQSEDNPKLWYAI